jgi:hypothetical protein
LLNEKLIVEMSGPSSCHSIVQERTGRLRSSISEGVGIAIESE